MNCSRCKSGLLVPDHYLDLYAEDGTLWQRGWRCVACGDIVDRTILRHRALQSTLRLRLLQPIPVHRTAAGRVLQGVA